MAATPETTLFLETNGSPSVKSMLASIKEQTTTRTIKEHTYLCPVCQVMYTSRSRAEECVRHHMQADEWKEFVAGICAATTIRELLAAMFITVSHPNFLWNENAQ